MAILMTRLEIGLSFPGIYIPRSILHNGRLLVLEASIHSITTTFTAHLLPSRASSQAPSQERSQSPRTPSPSFHPLSTHPLHTYSPKHPLTLSDRLSNAHLQ